MKIVQLKSEAPWYECALKTYSRNWQRQDKEKKVEMAKVTFMLCVLSSKAQLSMGTWSNKFKSFKCHIIFKNKNFICTKEFRNPHVMVSSLVTQSKTLSRAALTFCSSLCFYGAVPFSCCVLMLHKNKLAAW